MRGRARISTGGVRYFEIGAAAEWEFGQDTTAHYEIADSEYLREAAAATDAIIREIDKHSSRELWPKPAG